MPIQNKKRFWNWTEPRNEDGAPSGERVLFLSGAIAEESWFDDEVTPKLFKDELMAGDGDITVWINSPGGDCVAAAQIYNMLIDYPANVTIKIDGLAASAASVIAMAGTKVLMSPVGLMMIHNPLTMVAGDSAEMQKAIEMLDSVKESIINAYEIKTGLSRNKLSRLMDEETWMDARKAMELGFIDGILEPSDLSSAPIREEPVMYSRKTAANELRNRISARVPKPQVEDGRNVAELYERLRLIEL
jgi:ATP-dependent Clp protease protease subunit